MDDIRPRCGWCNLSNPVYVAYHDAEWAVPSHDDHHLFEMLVLETFQAGLSWETILNKRKRFRQAFDGFDIERIRRYDENKIAELMNDPGIIRNRRKIVATVGMPTHSGISRRRTAVSTTIFGGSPAVTSSTRQA